MTDMEDARVVEAEGQPCHEASVVSLPQGYQWPSLID